MNETPQDPARALVDPAGRALPAAPAPSTACPGCHQDPVKRRASGGFGKPHPVCVTCGYAWTEEVWRG